MPKVLLLFLLVTVGCSQKNSNPRAGKAPEEPAQDNKEHASQQPHRIEAEHLPNPVHIHAKVISGGQPEGDEAFKELQSLGVKTVISVDAMRPDVETARNYGLRYVHLPHGYDGVPDERVKELAKAVRDLDGPIYIHCHHGKHRSPTAATVACVAAGLVPKTQSEAILELAGTNLNYRGLYEAARNVKPLEAALLDELEVDFRETAEVRPIAEAMVAMGHTHDHLKWIAAAGWHRPADHPDLEPAHEALLMREHFTELLRTDYLQEEPEKFRRLLQDSEKAAQGLEDALRAWTPTSATAEPPETITRLAVSISANCQSCHETFRDIPLGEK
ncbi:MAG: hypothetical protein KDB27_14545 [Planctomycetales bacterium]|nr:hypothetical protein [Planctomycetales bacterium]